MDISRCLAYLISRRASMGFHRELDEAADTGKPSSFSRKETHTQNKIGLSSQLNKWQCWSQDSQRGKRETALRCSHPDKGSNVIKDGKSKKGGMRGLMRFSLMKNCQELL